MAAKSPSAPPSVMTLSLSDLILDPRLQMREVMRADVIDDYAEHVAELPPGKAVMTEDGLFWLYDGCHSFYAHKKAKLSNMLVTVTRGTYLDALAYAASSNQAHGLRRTNGDKRRAVEALLAEPTWQNRSSRMIAEICHVSHMLVEEIRNPTQDPTESEDTSKNGTKNSSEKSTGNSASRNSEEEEPEKRQGKDGKKRSTKPPKVPAILCGHCKKLAEKGTPVIKKCKDCKLAREKDRAKDRLCERCTEIGYQEGCTACQYLRDNPKASQPPKEPDKLLDEAGRVVPQRLIKVFKVAPLFLQAERELNALGKTFKEIEASPAKHAKPLDKEKQHFEKFFGVFKNARWRVKNMRPSVVCTHCEGDGCTKCDDLGWLTSEAAKVKGMI